ncbi:MAG: hypothetical protein L7H04_05220 [Vulcanisaeta sp.]|jgi:A/G-specific adenine glycosylase|nr:hypothetical protein [Vulcanisaeta sp.]MCG2909098.1 hypothetical protein [Stygiolobus sp.]MDT7906186.1 hypothetical protein [Sulfolobales archaeon]
MKFIEEELNEVKRHGRHIFLVILSMKDGGCIKLPEAYESKCTVLINGLLKWYSENSSLLNRKWRKDTDIFRSVMTELLLIRTRREAVENIYDVFFSKFRSPEDILRASKEDLEKAVYSLGMRKRVLLLKRAAAYLKEHEIRSPEDIDGLPGAGEYVKSILKLKLFNKGNTAVDRNGARVLFRYFYGYVPDVEKLEKCKEVERIRKECLDFYDDKLTLSYALMDLGYYVCKPRKPECNKCPLKDTCKYARGTL